MPRTSNHTSGGYCVGVPPLPIPNREVKPDCADGTAIQCGRVGGRLFSTNPRKDLFPHGGFCVYGDEYLYIYKTLSDKCDDGF